MTEIFGPLVKTLRFEAKYSYFKSCLAGNKKQKKHFPNCGKTASDVRFLLIHRRAFKNARTHSALEFRKK